MLDCTQGPFFVLYPERYTCTFSSYLILSFRSLLFHCTEPHPALPGITLYWLRVRSRDMICIELEAEDLDLDSRYRYRYALPVSVSSLDLVARAPRPDHTRAAPARRARKLQAQARACSARTAPRALVMCSFHLSQSHPQSSCHL